VSRGMFVTFEGGEGVGKSTQVAELCKRLEDAGVSFTVIRNPGGTSLGEPVRDILLHRSELSISDRSEFLLYAASRAQLVAEVIIPALERGDVVVCDRFADSTLAYQGYGRGLDLQAVRTMNAWSSEDLMPDLTVLIDVGVDVGLGRATIGGADRLEAEPEEFHERVRRGFLEIVRADPDRFLLVEATESVEKIASSVWARVCELLECTENGCSCDAE